MKSVTYEALYRGTEPASGTAAPGPKMAHSRSFLSGLPSELRDPPGKFLHGRYRRTPAFSSLHLHRLEGGLECAQSVLLSLPPGHFNPLGQYLSGFFLPALVKQEHSRLIVGR